MMKKELDVGPLLGEQMGSAPTVSVTCPPGFAPGAAFVVQDPSSGQQMQVVVPDGITPGQTFQVQVPFSVPAPVPMAQPYVEQQYAPQPVPPQQAPIIINNNNNDNNINTMQMHAPTPQQMYTHEPSTGWQSGLFECCNDIPVCALRPAAAHSKQLAPALAHPRPEDCVACHCPPSCRIVMSPPLSVQVSASGAASPVPTGCSSTCTWKTRCFRTRRIALFPSSARALFSAPVPPIVWQAEGHMPFGNFGACFGAFCFKGLFGPPAANIAASVISGYIYSTTATIVSAAPLYNPIGVIIAAWTVGSIMCLVTSRNRSSIRNNLNLKVRGF